MENGRLKIELMHMGSWHRLKVWICDFVMSLFVMNEKFVDGEGGGTMGSGV